MVTTLLVGKDNAEGRALLEELGMPFRDIQRDEEEAAPAAEESKPAEEGDAAEDEKAEEEAPVTAE